MLKGYFNHVWLPSISFELVDGNPPKKIVKRKIRAQIKIGAPVTFLARYNMNRSTDEARKQSLEKVRTSMERF